MEVPIIPTITDTDENLIQITNYIKTLKNIHRVDLLPYNKLGEEKYRRLNRVYRTKDIPIPSEERMEEIKTYFEREGLKVKLGG